MSKTSQPTFMVGGEKRSQRDIELIAQMENQIWLNVEKITKLERKIQELEAELATLKAESKYFGRET